MSGSDTSETQKTSLDDKKQTLLTSIMTQTDMSVNSSSSSSNSFYQCVDSRSGHFLTIVILGTKSFLLSPLFILVFFLGYRRWREQHSFAATSHTDVLTYHMAVMELLSVLGTTVYTCGSSTSSLEVTTVGLILSSIFYPGQMFFHILTCVERYLAVCHPITYLRLRQRGGVRIRNISIVCVWLLCFGWTVLLVVNLPEPPTALFFCLMTFSILVVSFCSVSVLCVLIRPGPGEVGGNRERVDQTKLRAFYTTSAITSVLWLWLTASLVTLALFNSDLLGHSERCLLLVSTDWFSLPSSLVLPLLFLHRAGKLLCCH